MEGDTEGDTEGESEVKVKIILAPNFEYIKLPEALTYNPYSSVPKGFVEYVFPKRIRPPFTLRFLVEEYAWPL